MKILVTGGAGFIGTNFIHLLMDETDHSIVNLDALTYAGNRFGCRKYEDDKRYVFIEGNICNKEKVASIMQAHRFDTIVNFAAESHVDRSIHDTSAFIQTNIMGTQVLLELARAHKALYVQISTDEVYGDLTLDENAFTELSPIKPSSPYAASKASADMLVLAAHRTHKQPVIITRCSNNYGPFQHPEKLIPQTIYKAHQNKPIPIYGQGLNVRDWIYVEDHCRGILAAMQNGLPGNVYNFGSANEKKNIDVARSILLEMKKGEGLLTYVKDRPGHDLRYAINFSKAHKDLAWSPRVTFGDGLSRTITWYNDNQEWLSHVRISEHESFFKKHYGEI